MDIIEAIVRERSLFRPRDMEARGISRSWIRFPLLLGSVQRVAPGIYGHAGVQYPPEAIMSVMVPHGIACLTTALHLHQRAEAAAAVA